MSEIRCFWHRIHWPAVVSALVTTSGLLLDPSMLNVVPDRYSKLLIGVGSVCQLLTKYVLKPRQPSPDAEHL